MEVRELSLFVVGIDYPNEDRGRTNRRFEAQLCAPGDPVELRPEPKNKHDENAIAVFSERGVQIGYITADRAPWINMRMGREDHEAVFQELLPAVAVIRIRFGGGTPTLPPPAKRTPIASSDDFYPDPDGPEWGA